MNPITMPVRELKNALAGLGKVISKRTTLPVLSHLRVGRSSDGRVELAATDLDSAVIVAIDEPAPGQPIHFLVPFEELNNTVKSCSRDDTLIVAPVSKSEVSFRFPVGGQTIEHRCASLPVEEFPPITKIEGDATPLDDSVRRAIHNAIECASTDSTRININGAFIDVSKPDAHYVVGTDGRHLFSSNSFALPLKDSLIIPTHRFLGWKEFNNDGDWSLRVKALKKNDSPQFEIASKHWRFISRSREGNYPNWRQVVPSAGSFQTTVEIDPESMDEVAHIIARFPDHDPINHSIGVEIKDRKVSLVGKASAEGKLTRVELSDMKATGRDVTIYLNRQFTKALRFGLNRIDLIDPMSPLRFSHGGRQMIVMPVRPDSMSPKPIPPPPAAPAAQQPAPPSAEPQQETKPIPEQPGKTTGAPRSTTPAASTEKTALETALAQTEIMRGDFRNAIAGLNKLAETLRLAQREQKTNEKEVSSVRQTLRSLQSVRI